MKQKCISLFLFVSAINLPFGYISPETTQKPENEAILGYHGDSGAVIGRSTPPLPKIMEKIAFCESSNNPEAINHNKNGSHDVGYFQINSIWHDKARQMGYNIYKLEDNIAFALWLYEKQGTSPWKYSKKCWEI